MRVEAMVLVGSVLLGLIHICLATAAATKARGTAWNFSSRGQNVPPLTGVAGQLERAQKNFFETYPLVLGTLLALLMTSRFGPWSELGSEIYLGARIAYLPIYAAGIPVVRTGVWLLSVLGLVLMLAALVL